MLITGSSGINAIVERTLPIRYEAEKILRMNPSELNNYIAKNGAPTYEVSSKVTELRKELASDPSMVMLTI